MRNLHRHGASVHPIRLPAARRLASGFLGAMLLGALFIGGATATAVVLHHVTGHPTSSSCLFQR